MGQNREESLTFGGLKTKGGMGRPFENRLEKTKYERSLFFVVSISYLHLTFHPEDL